MITLSDILFNSFGIRKTPKREIIDIGYTEITEEGEIQHPINQNLLEHNKK